MVPSVHVRRAAFVLVLLLLCGALGLAAVGTHEPDAGSGGRDGVGARFDPTGSHPLPNEDRAISER